MVTTMRRLLAALLLLAAAGSAEAQTFGSSTIETTPTTLSPVSTVFTPPCPTLGGGFAVHNIVVTAANQSIALPTCPSSAIGLFVTLNICNGKGGTAPCNGTASGPFSPGIIFGAGFEFPGTTVFTETQVSGGKDLVTCEVMGTTGPWSCGAPQYTETIIGAGWTLVAHKAAAGASNPQTAATNTTGATFFVVGISYSGGAGTVSDTSSNTYTQAGATQTSGSIVNKLFYVYAPTTGATQQFTCSASFCVITVAAFIRPTGGTQALDQATGNTAGGGAGTSIATGSLTPAQTNELAVTSMVFDVGGSGATANGGFTVTDEIDGASSVNEGGGLSWFNATAAAVNPTWSWTGPVTNATTLGLFK